MTQLYDASSNANYATWTTKHTKLDVELDFHNKVLVGTATLSLDSVESASELILDTSNLSIGSVSIDGQAVKYDLKPRKDFRGQPLVIEVPQASSETNSLELTISYSTTEGCTALQWLSPEQTAGDKPYVFSQCQAIHARSMYPCQDTPLIKSPFTFNLRSPYPVVATGNFRGTTDYRNGSLIYAFEQPVPIPSYLAA